MSQCHFTAAEKCQLLLRLACFKDNVISQAQQVSLIIETIVKTVYLSLIEASSMIYKM